MRRDAQRKHTGEMREIKVGCMGPNLTSRDAAASLRRSIGMGMREQKEVMLDFTGVQRIAPLFAKECFFRLTREWSRPELERRLRLKGASPMVLSAIRYSMLSASDETGVAEGII